MVRKFYSFTHVLNLILFPVVSLQSIYTTLTLQYGNTKKSLYISLRYGAALRGLYIIDPNGVIRSMTINDDQVGRSVNETLRLLQAFQYSDSHDGEVCPANWKKGDATIRANHDDKVEFFQAVFGEEDSA